MSFESTSSSQTQPPQKGTRAWREECWRRWPKPEDWPPVMDVYESAAYLRVSYDCIYDCLAVARDRKARLAHQRVRGCYRIRKVDLDGFGRIEGRS